MSKTLQDRLLHYSAEPPTRVWDRINAALDARTDDLPERLARYQQAPHPSVWHRIETALDNKLHGTPLHLRYRRWIGYAAAAVLISAIIVTAVMLNNKTTESTVARNPPPAEHPQVPAATEPVQDTSPGITPADTPREVTPVRTRNIAASKPAQRKKLHRPATASGNYVVYSSLDGSAMRVSRKVVPLVRCAEENLTCWLHLRMLQEKAATSMSADFTGVLEMLTNLRENK
ncbi:MAG TPA: hypothetical protein VFZ78_11500 [Flavisolibacter sp.]